jgi:hypothetical protein
MSRQDKDTVAQRRLHCLAKDYRATHDEPEPDPQCRVDSPGRSETSGTKNHPLRGTLSRSHR